MPALKAEFDGGVFVPCGEVKLPVETQVEVLLAGLLLSCPSISGKLMTST